MFQTLISGNGTFKQKMAYTAVGTLFWMTIVLIANYFGLEKLRVTVSDCNRQYRICISNNTYDPCTLAFNHCRENGEFIHPNAEIRKISEKSPEIVDEHFSEIDQEMNIRVCNQQVFYGRKICEGLCGNTLECFTLCAAMADENEQLSSKICPYASLCRNGCPCKYFKCTKQGKRGLQVVQDVQKYRRKQMPKVCLHDFYRQFNETTSCMTLTLDQKNNLAEYGFDCWYYYMRMTSVLFEGKFYLVSFMGGFAEFDGAELIPRIPPPRAG